MQGLGLLPVVSRDDRAVGVASNNLSSRHQTDLPIRWNRCTEIDFLTDELADMTTRARADFPERPGPGRAAPDLSGAADDMPRVSVVIATNRGGPFLADALRSVESQTYPHIETVLVDDGAHAPEDVAATAAAFPSVRLIRQANAGASVARNAGVSHTTGQLIVFLDDDDRWHPERITSQVEALAADSTAVASYCGMRTIDDSGGEILPGDQRQAHDIHAIFRREAGIILPNLMMRRDTFLRVGGFHPGFRQAEDLDLVLKVALEGSLAFVPQTLVDYRYHARNVTRSHRELARSIDAVLRLHRWAAQERGREDLVKDLDFSLAANGRFAMWSVSRFAREEVRQGRYGLALREAIWAVGFAPKAPLSWLQRRIDRVRVRIRRTARNEDAAGGAGAWGERQPDGAFP